MHVTYENILLDKLPRSHNNYKCLIYSLLGNTNPLTVKRKVLDLTEINFVLSDKDKQE